MFEKGMAPSIRNMTRADSPARKPCNMQNGF